MALYTYRCVSYIGSRYRVFWCLLAISARYATDRECCASRCERIVVFSPGCLRRPLGRLSLTFSQEQYHFAANTGRQRSKSFSSSFVRRRVFHPRTACSQLIYHPSGHPHLASDTDTNHRRRHVCRPPQDVHCDQRSTASSISTHILTESPTSATTPRQGTTWPWSPQALSSA